jgi:hypothetical protein
MHLNGLHKENMPYVMTTAKEITTIAGITDIKFVGVGILNIVFAVL